MIKRVIQEFQEMILFIKNGDKATVKLVKKHIVSFVVLVFVIVSSFIFLYIIIDLQSQSPKYINQSGKQRIMTQKASFMALQLKYTQEEKLKSEILNIISKILDSQYLLYQNLMMDDNIFYHTLNAKTTNLYYQALQIEQNNGVDIRFLDSFINDANILVDYFDKATYLQEKLISEKIFKIKIILVFLCLILLATVVAEAFFIFKPAILEIIKKNLKLNKLNKLLTKKVKKEVAIRRKQEIILIQKTKEAELGELINNIAHQWRQPITILGLYLETIKIEYNDGTLTKKDMDDLISKSLHTISYMSQTIDDFRSFFMPSIKDEVFNIYESIHRVEKLLGYILTHKNIRLHKEYAEESIGEFNLFGKRNDFEQCLMVIFNNAKDAIINYRKETQNESVGHISIDLKTKNGYVYCYIKDDGGGIKKEFQNKIFDAYFSTKGETGTGVGLYMCKNIMCSIFHGDISFETQDCYTTFIIKVKSLVEDGERRT